MVCFFIEQNMNKKDRQITMTGGFDMTMRSLASMGVPEFRPEFRAVTSSGQQHDRVMPDAVSHDRQRRAERFRTLRRDVAGIEGRGGTARLPLGVESLDSALAGGLVPGRVHLLSGRPGHDGALTGFTVALLRRALAHLDDSQADDAAPVVWCPAAAAGASGMLYAAGLAALGIDPGRLLIVDSPSPGQRLAALEDILRTSGLAAVVMEYDGVSQSGDYWMRLARRAQLAAEASGVTGFLTGWPVAASGFETQWRIAPAATRVATDPSPSWSSPWSPCWQVELLQARGGRPHATRLCWQSPDNRFRDLGPSPVEGEAAAPPLPLGAPPGGLPRRIVGRRPAMTPRATLAGRLAG